MPNNTWTAARIKKLRDRYGETQEVFAARLRISAATLRYWERSKDGKGQPSGPATIVLEQLEEMAEELQPA